MREEKRIVCIVQSRMGALRLPNKSMMPLGGKPMLQTLLERIQSAQRIDELVLATTEHEEDSVLVDLAKRLGVSVFRGHPTDLIDRYYHAAKAFKAEIVVRIPADNPLVHASEIDRIIEYFIVHDDIEFASNLGPVFDNGYPDGLGAEVFEMSLLEQLQRIEDPAHRQDVVPSYIFSNPGKFRVGSVKCPSEFSRPDIVLDINTQKEYEFIAKLYEDLSRPNEQIDIRDIIPWYDSTPLQRE